MEPPPFNVRSLEYLKHIAVRKFLASPCRDTTMAEELATELIDIRPLVNLGPFEGLDIIKERDRRPLIYLTDADLDQYLATHPIYDPPNDRGGCVSKEFVEHMENESKKQKARDAENP